MDFDRKVCHGGERKVILLLRARSCKQAAYVRALSWRCRKINATLRGKDRETFDLPIVIHVRLDVRLQCVESALPLKTARRAKQPARTSLQGALTASASVAAVLHEITMRAHWGACVRGAMLRGFSASRQDIIAARACIVFLLLGIDAN